MKTVLAWLLFSTLAHADQAPITEEQYAQVMDRLASKLELAAHELEKRPFTSSLDLVAAMRAISPSRTDLARATLDELHLSPEQLAAFVAAHPDAMKMTTFLERIKRAGAGLAAKARDLPKIYDVDGATRRAERTHKPLFLIFTADWCAPCKEMMDRTLTDPKVLDILHGYEVAMIDETEDNEKTQAAQAKYKAATLPTLLVLRAGKEVARVEKLVSAAELAALLAP